LHTRIYPNWIEGYEQVCATQFSRNLPNNFLYKFCFMPANNCQQNSETLSIKQPIRIYYVKHNPKYFIICSFPGANPAPSKTSHIP